MSDQPELRIGKLLAEYQRLSSHARQCAFRTRTDTIKISPAQALVAIVSLQSIWAVCLVVTTALLTWIIVGPIPLRIVAAASLIPVAVLILLAWAARDLKRDRTVDHRLVWDDWSRRVASGLLRHTDRRTAEYVHDLHGRDVRFKYQFGVASAAAVVFLFGVARGLGLLPPPVWNVMNDHPQWPLAVLVAIVLLLAALVYSPKWYHEHIDAGVRHYLHVLPETAEDSDSERHIT